MRPLLLSAVSSPSSDFTAAVNDTMSDIVSALNDSSVNLTATFSEYVKAVAFYHFNETVSLNANITESLIHCISQEILNHLYSKTSSAIEVLIELLHNISTAIRILKQVIVTCSYVKNV